MGDRKKDNEDHEDMRRRALQSNVEKKVIRNDFNINSSSCKYINANDILRINMVHKLVRAFISLTRFKTDHEANALKKLVSERISISFNLTPLSSL